MDSQIDPVLQRYSERTTQSRIDQHYMAYHDNTRFAKIASERLRTTVQQITGKSLVGDTSVPKKTTRKKASTSDTSKVPSEIPLPQSSTHIENGQQTIATKPQKNKKEQNKRID
jgi:hypothetical protein